MCVYNFNLLVFTTGKHFVLYIWCCRYLITLGAPTPQIVIEHWFLNATTSFHFHFVGTCISSLYLFFSTLSFQKGLNGTTVITLGSFTIMFRLLVYISIFLLFIFLFGGRKNDHCNIVPRTRFVLLNENCNSVLVWRIIYKSFIKFLPLYFVCLVHMWRSEDGF